MTHNEPRGLTDEEAIEIAVQHLVHDTLHWGDAVTEEQARATIARMRADDDRFTPEVARARVWAEHRATVIDLTDPATRAAYYEQSA